MITVGVYIKRVMDLPASPFRYGYVARVVELTRTKEGQAWVYIDWPNEYGVGGGCIRETVEEATEEDVVRYHLAGGISGLPYLL